MDKKDKRIGVRYYWDDKSNEIVKFDCWVSDRYTPSLWIFFSTEEVCRRWVCRDRDIGRVVRGNSIFFLDEKDINDSVIRTMFKLHFAAEACKLRREADIADKKGESISVATLVSFVEIRRG